MSSKFWFRLLSGVAIGALSQPAMAQRAAENAVANADDAFGSQVGLESSGIYSENDTRGLSPLKAGNARLDGIYFDPVATVSGRTRAGYDIRIGIASMDYAFAAPTGVVDNRLRTAGDKFTASLVLTKLQYSGRIEELDVQVPIKDGALSLAAGYAEALTVTGDGGRLASNAFLVKPVIRLAGAEVSPFYAGSKLHDVAARPFFTTSGALLPPQPKLGHYLGQDWARGEIMQVNYGVTAKVPIADRLAFRGGIFRSSQSRRRNFSEVFSFAAPGHVATHRLIADPRQELHSVSGEGQLAYRFGGGERLIHRVLLGYRARHRYTESGGSDVHNLGSIDINGTDPESEPVFSFRAVNVGKVDQSAVTLGYQLHAKGVGRLNLGLQRARYRAGFTDAQTGLTSNSRENAWLYNASATIDVAKGVEVFFGTQKGLEDSGAAPENAVNRNEQLPTTRSTQYEGGMRWKFGTTRVVGSLFQITRPYFSFDTAGNFTELGTARYRGAELSLVSHIDRLTILAGAVATKPEVSGLGRIAGIVGERTAGTPDLYARVDLQYRTNIFGGVTPTLALVHIGERAMGSAPVPALGGQQAMLEPFTVVDLGVRHQFKLGSVPASLRATLYNVFNTHGWKVIASNTLQPEEHRRLMISVSADF